MDPPSEESLAERERDLGPQMARASRAQAILDDPLFVEAVQAIRDECHRTFAESPLSDDQSRQEARFGLWALEKVIGKLATHTQTGRFAEIEKAQIEQQRRIRDAEPGENAWQ